MTPRLFALISSVLLLLQPLATVFSANLPLSRMKRDTLDNRISSPTAQPCKRKGIESCRNARDKCLRVIKEASPNLTVRMEAKPNCYSKAIARDLKQFRAFAKSDSPISQENCAHELRKCKLEEHDCLIANRRISKYITLLDNQGDECISDRPSPISHEGNEEHAQGPGLGEADGVVHGSEGGAGSTSPSPSPTPTAHEGARDDGGDHGQDHADQAEGAEDGLGEGGQLQAPSLNSQGQEDDQAGESDGDDVAHDEELVTPSGLDDPSEPKYLKSRIRTTRSTVQVSRPELDIRNVYENEWIKETDAKKISFKIKGKMIGSVSFGHVIYDHDVGALKRHVNAFCKLIKDGVDRANVSSSAAHVNHVNQHITMQAVHYLEGCQRLEGKIDDVLTLWFQGAQRKSQALDDNLKSQPPRVKRQIMVLGAIAAVTGIVALFSYLFHPPALAEISIGAQTSKATITTLQEHEKSVTVNKRSIELLNKTIVEVDEAVTSLTKRMEWMGNINFHYEEMKWKVELLLRGLEHLHTGHMSSELIAPTPLQRIVSNLRQRLLEINFVLGPTDVEDFYRADTSFIVFENLTIRSITHLPIYHESSLLTLFEYVSLPLEVGPDHFLELHPRNKIMAVNKDNTLYKTFSASDLSLCEKVSGLFYCKHSNHYYRTTYSTCVYYLYTRNLEKVQEECPVSLEVKRDKVLQIANDEVIVFHRKEQTATHICEMATTHEEEITFEGFKTFVLKPGCRVQTPNFVMEGTSDIFYQAETVLDKEMDLENDDLVLDLGMHLNYFMNDLREVGSDRNLTIRDLTALFAHEKRTHFSISILTGLIILAGLILLCYCWCKCRGSGGPTVVVQGPEAPRKQIPSFFRRRRQFKRMEPEQMSKRRSRNYQEPMQEIPTAPEEIELKPINNLRQEAIQSPNQILSMGQQLFNYSPDQEGAY